MKNIALVLHESKCSLNCVFCNGREMGDIEKNIEFELKKLRAFVKHAGEVDLVEISGNDPCEYERLADFVREVKEIANPKEIMISTHGGMLSDYSYLKNLLEAGANAFRIPVYGALPEVHEAVTATKGSFENLVRVLKNIRRAKLKEKYRIRLLITSQIVRDNQHHLKELFYLFKLLSDFADEFYISIPGFVKENERYRKHVPDFEQLRRELPKALRFAMKLGINLVVHDIPMCLVGFKYAKYINTSPASTLAYEYRRFIRDPIIKEINGTAFPDYLIKVKSRVCRECIYNRECEGIYKNYVEEGFFRFTPVKSKN